MSLRNNRLRELEELYRNDKKRPATQEFDEWLDNILSAFPRYEKGLQTYGQFISIDSISDSHVVLTDYSTDKHVFVNINTKKKRLECKKKTPHQIVYMLVIASRYLQYLIF